VPAKITVEIIEARLKCRYKGHLKLAGELGEPSDYGLLLGESRAHVRASASARLLARQAGHDVPRGLPLDAELLKRGSPLILDATFEDDDLCVRFDALLRVDGDSSLGGFRYAPVLFHEAERPTPDLRVLLAALAELLGPLQGKALAFGVLIHGRGCRERRVKLASAAKEARCLLRELREGGAPRRPGWC